MFALEACDRLKTLDLRSNRIGGSGVVALAAVLGGGACSGLRELFLNDNHIGFCDEGAAALAVRPFRVATLLP